MQERSWANQSLLFEGCVSQRIGVYIQVRMVFWWAFIHVGPINRDFTLFLEFQADVSFCVVDFKIKTTFTVIQ